METRANYALIGLFTLAVIASAFGFVYWFSGGDRGQARQAVRIVFSGSVSGLSKGSGVLFNGHAGRRGHGDQPAAGGPAPGGGHRRVDRNTPIRTDTRARLEYQGLTGVAQIALVGGEPGAPPLAAGPGQPLPTIFADRSDFQDLIETARNIARRADDVLGAGRPGRLRQRRLHQPHRSRTSSASRRRSATTRLASTASWPRSGRRPERIGPLAEKLETLADQRRRGGARGRPQRVARIVENVEGFTQALGENRQAIANTLKDAASLASRLNESARSSMRAHRPRHHRPGHRSGQGRPHGRQRRRFTGSTPSRQRVDRIVKNTSTVPQALGETGRVDNALRDAASLVAPLNETAPKLDRRLSEVAQGRPSIDPRRSDAPSTTSTASPRRSAASSPDVDKTIQEARSITEKLNKSADRIDGVLKAAENFLGSASGEAGQGSLRRDPRSGALHPRAGRQPRQAHGRDHSGRGPLHRLGPARSTRRWRRRDARPSTTSAARCAASSAIHSS